MRERAQDRGPLQLVHGRGAIEAKGLAPLRPHLEAIAAIKNKTELAIVPWGKLYALTSTR